MPVVASGAEFAVNTAITANQTGPSTAGFTDGGFVVVWVTLDTAQDGSGNAIKGQRFDADGARLGDEFLVNSQAAASQFGPVVATFPDGSFVAAWVTGDTAQDGSGNAIKAQLFDANGVKVGPEFLVNTSTASSQFTPNVTVLADGNFVVSWDDFNGFDMRAQVFDPAGAKLGAEFRVNVNTNAFQEFGDIVALAGGGFAATWRTTDSSADGSGYAIKARVFDAAGTGGAEFLVNSIAAGDPLSGSVGALADGGFVVTWYTTDTVHDGSGYAIKAQRFDSAGGKVGGEFLVNSHALGFQSDPQVTGLAGGGFVITWTSDDPLQDGSGHAIKAQAYDAEGAPIGGEFLVNTDSAGAQTLADITALSATEFVIVWASATGDASGTGLRGQKFTVEAPNSAPVIVSGGGGTSAFLTRPENGVDVTTILAVDPEGGAISYAIIGGPDADLFTIDAETGVLRFNAAPDYEAPIDFAEDNFYTVIVAASDGELSTMQRIEIVIDNVNEGLAIVSDGGGESATVTVGENSLAATMVAASDLDGDPIAYAIVGGADAALFAIDAATGALSFLAAPDHEAPGDADLDNVYELVVQASDGRFADTQMLSIVLTNTDEAPAITSDGGGDTASIQVAENSYAVTQVAASDPEGAPRSYAITGGADGARFVIDQLTGALSFIATPDFDAPGDADGDNVYLVLVSASDGTLSDSQALSVIVTNVAEAPVIVSNGGGAAAAVTVNENVAAVTVVAASDPDGGAISYAITGGADAARFAIDAATGALSFVAAPNFEAPADADGDNVYDVVVTASDGSLADVQALSVTIANLADGVTLTGTNGGNTLTGGSAEDILRGLGGNDTLVGNGGPDLIEGGAGNDVIVGGLGADRLIGGSGADRFTFTSIGESSAAAYDTVADFSRGDKDRIALADIDARTNVGGNQSFAWIGTAAFSGVSGQLRYSVSSGGAFVMGDTNGDGSADFMIRLDGVTSLSAGDFVL